MFDNVFSDLQHGLRRLRRRPIPSAAIVLTIALGSGAVTALFAVVDRLVLRPLPIAEPERAFLVRSQDKSRNNRLLAMNPGDAYDVRARMPEFAVAASYNESETTILLRADATPERVRMALVDSGLPSALGMTPALGRFFSAEDYDGSSNNAVISHRLWRRLFNADPNAIGRTFLLNNVARTVIGVLPPSGDVLPEPDFEVWRPQLDNPQQRAQARTAVFLRMVARVKPGITAQSAQASLDVVAQRISQEQPLTNATRRFVLQPLLEGVVGPAGATLTLLGGALVALLFIACASVSNVLVARSHARSHELAVRAAMGGSSVRLAQQLITETMVLCVLGGLLGLALSPLVLNGFVQLYPGQLPRAAELGIDWRTLVLSLAAIVVAGIIASIPAIRRAGQLDLNQQLHGARTSGSRRERRVAGALVVGQLAVSIMLLFGGTLLLKSYRGLTAIDPGIETERLLTFNVAPSSAKYGTTELTDGFYRDLLTQLHGLPGVRAVGVSTLLPFAPGEWTEGFIREGTADTRPNTPFAKLQVVSDDYINAIGLALLRGRTLTAADRDSMPMVVVVNARFAAEHYPGREVLGKRIIIGDTPLEIVGVVSDKRHISMKDAPVAEMFVPRLQRQRQLRGWIAVRASGDPTALISTIRNVMRGIDPTIAVANVATMKERFSASIAADRFRAVVVGAFATVALILATLGLYGVISATVSRRTREIGIRMALGESRSGVVRSVARQSFVYCLSGLAVGVAASLVGGRMLESVLVATSTRDASALGTVVLALGIIAFAASYLPVLRASRVDPMIALRSD